MFRLGSVILGPVPRVAAVVTAPEDLEGLPAALLDGVDLFEVRADMFPDCRPEPVGRALEACRALGKGVLLTVRSPGEGGEKDLDAGRRLELFRRLLPLADGIDLEVSSTSLWDDLAGACRKGGKLLIGSFHDFTETPSGERIAELEGRARRLGAEVFKVACTARSPEDVARLLSFCARRRAEGVIALSMGSWGGISRLAAPLLGGLLTYGYLSRPSAPGQMSCAELAELLRRFRPEVAGNT